MGTRFEDPILVAVTTLAVAATFHPLRRRLQSWVDRRFNRSRYDIEEVMTTFAGSLRHHVDTDRSSRVSSMWSRAPCNQRWSASRFGTERPPESSVVFIVFVDGFEVYAEEIGKLPE